MTRLSKLFRDPDVARAFERAERDNGDGLTIPAPVHPVAPKSGEVCHEPA